MKFLISFFLCFITGCTTVSELESVKRGEGQRVFFDLSQEKMLELGQRAFEDSGLVVRRVNQRPDRVEILGYQPSELGEHGAVYGLYLYPLRPNETEVYLVRKKRYPSEVFSSDVREEVLARLDELVLEVQGN